MRYLILISLCLASCIQQPDYAQQCRNMGVMDGDAGFVNCQLSLQQQRQQALMAIYGMQQRNYVAPQPYAMPVNNVYSTNCNRYGNSINCSTYGGR